MSEKTGLNIINKLHKSNGINEQEEYWLEKFSGEIPVLNLPTDYQRTGTRCFEGNFTDFLVDEEITNKLRQIAKETGTTIFMVLLAAYNVLLSKYSGQEDIVIGSPIPERQYADSENILVMSKNILAMRNQPEGYKTFGDFLREVKENTIRAYENQDYQLTELVERLQAVSGFSRNSLFDVVLIFKNTNIMGVEGFNLSSYKLEHEIFESDIILEAEENKDIIRLNIKYNAKLFKKETIDTLAQHLINIVMTIAKNTEISLSSIDILTTHEWQKLLVEFNDTNVNYPKDKTLHELFEEQAERTPQNIALVYEERSIAYKELNEKANRLAHTLVQKGVKPDDIVAMLMDRSFEMSVGIMGILKAGGAYLPISPEYPEDRIKYMLEDSGAKILLTQTHLLDKLHTEAEVINLEDEMAYAKEASNLGETSKPTDIAYVIYTSGSTGKPKGAMIEHHSAVNRIKWMQKSYPIGAGGVILQKTPYTFDVSVWELFWWSMEGAAVAFLMPGGEKDPSEIVSAIEKYKISTMHFVPSMLNVFLEYIQHGGVDLYRLKSLRQVFASGEALNLSQVERFNKLLNESLGIKLINLYGPTEATVDVSYFNCSTGEKLELVPIGKPIDNIKLLIVNKYNQLVPVGVPGELCISGVGVGRGYLNRPELTAEKFVDNRYSQSEEYRKMYRTGDLARWLPDGNIEYLGRLDHQVKIRGFRIELGEIESQLLSYESVKEAVVIARDDNNGNKYLCAYIVGDRDFTVSELREHFSKYLPDYMIPSYFIKLDRLPLSPNGKLDRKALPELDGRISVGTTYVAPTNETEEALEEIWKDVLGIDSAGINDNFFDLGGHSLKAMSLINRIHKEFDVEIPLKIVFHLPTISRLSKYINSMEKSKYSEIKPINPRKYYEMSSTQKRIYTLQQIECNGTSYNIPSIMELDGKLDKDRLEYVLNRLIERHEVLRTSFEMMGEIPVQKVHDKVEFCIGHKKIERKEKLNEIIEGFIKPFNLSKAPLIKVELIEVHPEKYIFMIDMHHIISDGTSTEIFMEELGKLYEEKELPKLRIQYKDYAAWQNEMLKSAAMKKQEEYWLNSYRGEIPVLNLPTDYARPSVQSFEGENIYFELGKELTEGLKRITKETGTTMYMVLLAAVNILLSKYSGQEDIVVGSPIAGRLHPDLENIIGMFVNTLAIRNYPEGSKTFREFLEEVKVNALGAYENQNYQFEELVEKLDIRRDMSRNPLFDVMFVLQNTEARECVIEGLTLKRYEKKQSVSKFDITIEAIEKGERIEIGIEYCTKLYGKETIKRMEGHLKRILSETIENSNRRIEEISILTEEEKNLLLNEFNDEYMDYPRNKAVHELFEEQVERTPENIAVVYEDRYLTYRELNEKANQLARVLRKKGITADSLVGIMVERSLEMMIGIMGILKAGGAYLPIDPKYPRERIDYMLADSKASILLTQRKYCNNIEDNNFCIIDIEETLITSIESKENLNIKLDPSRLIYLIYTSGSTGNPKGAAVKSNSFTNLINWYVRDFEINENDNILLIAPIAFDLAQKNLYASLIKGGKLCVLSEGLHNYAKILKEIENERITIINCTPSAFQLVIDTATNYCELRHLRFVFLGGEPINLSKLACWTKSQYYKAEIVNTYGPTECTDIATYYTIPNDKIESITVIPIGNPIDNVKLYIVDKNNNLLALGQPGELCIGGIGVGRGYINKPELTAEKFIDNPFELGERMYRTGDLTRWLPDGNIEFLGRIDHQVKIRGYRIELGEIENRLLSHLEIKEAVVITRDDNGGNKYLCAFIVGERDFTVSELREYLSKDLPDYMIPSYFIKLDRLPLTPNGKIDRKALPEPDGRISVGPTYEAPTNETEERLVEIWKVVLGIESVGINDNFLDLGGHSLKAMSLITKTHKEFNVEIPLKKIFQFPTIKGLSKYIKGAGKNTYIEIVKAEDKKYYPLSSAQKRIFVLHQFDSTSIAYNMPNAVEIDGELDKDKLKECVIRLIERHESFRTSFELLNGVPVQKINKDVVFEIEHGETNANDIDELIKTFIKPFDLSKAPLLRVGLVQMHPKKHILLFDMHHIISDGVSIKIILDELASLYQDKDLQILKIQYKDYVLWQENLLRSERIRKEEKYWIERFKGEIPVLNMPTDYPRSNTLNFAAEQLVFELEKEFCSVLRQMAQETSTTLYMILLAMISILLSKYSGQEDIIIGSPISGRIHADLENTIGMFVNTVALRNQPNENKTFINFLEEVKVELLRAYENQDYPFEELINALRIERSLNRNPLFDILLNMHSSNDELLDSEMTRFRLLNINEFTARFDISITLDENKEKIGLIIVYKTSLYNKNTIELLVKHLKNLILTVKEDYTIEIKDISIIGNEDNVMMPILTNIESYDDDFEFN